MYQGRMDDNQWINDDHMDQPEDIGFDKEEIARVELFVNKPFDIPNFPKNEQIKQAGISSHMFVIITRQNNIYRWRPERDDYCVQMELPEAQQSGLTGKLLGGKKNERKDIILEKLFLFGPHALIVSDNGESFYINFKSDKIRSMEQLRGKQIKCVGWDDQCDETDTHEILLATKDSKIYIYRIDCRQAEVREEEAKLMVTIPNERQINQIEQFTVMYDNNKYACVVVSTNFSLFFFYGLNSLSILFTKYKDPQSVARAESQPSRYHTSLLAVSQRKNSFLFTNGKSLNLFTLPEKDLNESILQQAKQLKSVNNYSEMPVQIGLTDFHYFILSADSLTIFSKITQQEVQKYELRGMGRIMGMQYERDGKVFWIYSERTFCKIETEDEDKEAWKLLMDQKMYIDAYEISNKYNSEYTQYIAGLCGDQLFTQKRYNEAASYYQKSSKNFEEIFLKFLNCDDMKARIGLEQYLKHLINNLKGEIERTLVLGWLSELLIYRLNEQEKLIHETRNYENEAQRDKDIKEKKQQLNQLNEDLDHFLKTYKLELDQNLVYQIMVSHGRLQNCVEYAKLNNNYEMIIQHYINEENYKEAIKNLNNVKEKSSMEIIQKYSFILMKHEPEQTLDILQKNIKKFDQTKIIGGLMNIPVEKREFGIRFLEHLINKLDCADKSIHNILIFFLTQPLQKEKLNYYLQEQEALLKKTEKVNFDLDFALRLFKQASCIDAQITIYGMMSLYTESVTLALDYGMIEKAKEYAQKPEDDDEKKKKLWMMIAERLLSQNQDIDKVIELTKNSQQIKIEDLLPHFNENIKIEQFKDEICNSLKKYNEEIEKLKDEMKKLSANSDQLKNELKMTKNKFLIIDTQQKCDHCAKQLFNDTFYIFPCNHGFHKDCIVTRIKQLPQHQANIPSIETYDMTMQSILVKSNPTQNANKKQQDGQSFFQIMNIFGGAKQEQRPQSTLTPDEEKLLRETKDKFDKIVASECIFCGPKVVDSIQFGFELDAREKDTWSI
ncbi:unnamed protein product [Paramecium octaurelia]|uniref:Uncharacterized protein n=1 Tax=Paramecium octaurelia TaxID=43137 RepID=A0A8S1WLP5_PAROT|nr:unnamed protein product [Paramecium octaurelia]